MTINIQPASCFNYQATVFASYSKPEAQILGGPNKPYTSNHPRRCFAVRFSCRSFFKGTRIMSSSTSSLFIGSFWFRELRAKSWDSNELENGFRLQGLYDLSGCSGSYIGMCCRHGKTRMGIWGFTACHQDLREAKNPVEPEQQKCTTLA